MDNSNNLWFSFVTMAARSNYLQKKNIFYSSKGKAKPRKTVVVLLWVDDNNYYIMKADNFLGYQSGRVTVKCLINDGVCC